MKVNDIRQLSKEELNQKEKLLKKELFELTYQRKLGNVEKPGKFRKIKKEIARILTVINERKKEVKLSA